MYWLRLCPHFREPALEATLVRRRLFIVLMTAAHISPNIFSLRVFLTNIQWTSYYNTRQSTYSYHTSHSYIHLHPYIIHHIHIRSHLHFSCYSWQAGCPRLFVSDTETSCKSFLLHTQIKKMTLWHILTSKVRPKLQPCCSPSTWFTVVTDHLEVGELLMYCGLQSSASQHSN